MCALNGVFAYNPSANAPRRAELIATREHMAARGPDGAGEWWREDRRIGLAHRRLAIVDLSSRADQPMTSVDGKYVIVFNGEIYNHAELRKELVAKGAVFRSTSDTEVLLQLYAFDHEAMVERLRGMFAFAIWDSIRRRLFLARDPYGIKPLYVTNDGWTFRFASQVKALISGGGVSTDPDPAGAVGFALLGSAPEPFTLYREIEALPAGTMQIVDELGPRKPKTFSSVTDSLNVRAGKHFPRADCAELVRRGVAESIRAHLAADVEVGVFLSSGIDSGVILGVAGAERSGMPAVTIAFDSHSGGKHDETAGAKRTAQHYGARHTIRPVSDAEMKDALPQILRDMDQPSIDGVNTWFAARAAKEQGLKVILSGIGGDELFGGYPSFRHLPTCVGWLRRAAWLPGLGYAWRKLVTASGAAKARPKLAGLVEYGGSYAGAYLLRRGLFLPFEVKAMFDEEFAREGLRRLNVFAKLKAASLDGATASSCRVASIESNFYLRNQLLRDADWAGMAHGVEIRTPLVDLHLLRALAPSLPAIHRQGGKALLAQVPDKPLPKAILEKAKAGFAVPIESAIHAGGARHTARAWSGMVVRAFDSRLHWRSPVPA